MKDRIVKLKARRGKLDVDLKICKKCSKEYSEKENFNWSCRTHKSDWSGEMWFCCGKDKKEAQGCLFASHEEKKDDEDEDGNQEDVQKKCLCCKQMGHFIDDCPRDPNLKTGEDLLIED